MSIAVARSTARAWVPVSEPVKFSVAGGRQCGIFDRMDKQDFKSPWQKTIQVLLVAIFAFALGLYAVKFSGSGWDWGNVVGCLSAGALCALNLFILIRDFWKPKA
jgi:hypothetical protein